MTKKTVILPSNNPIAYWSHHDDKRPVLILVHGFTGSHEGFQYLVPLLSNFRLIIPDLPGFGVSPLPHEKLTLRELGSLLVDFVQALDLDDKPHLVGHSMGSLVVSEAMRQHPKLFAKKNILISPVPSPVGILDARKIGVLLSKLYYSASHRLPFVGPYIATSKKLTRLSTRLIMTTKDKLMKQTIYGHHFNNLKFISSIGWYRRLHKEVNKTGISRYRHALEQFDILIINGDRDSVTPPRKQKKTSKKINAKLVIIPKVGHLSHYEKPTELATAISEFLQ